MFGRTLWGRCVCGAMGGAILLLTGCGDFFSKNNNNNNNGNNTGSYTYVGTGTGVLASYSVSSTGALTAVGNPQTLASSGLNALAVTPGNGVLYTAVAGSGVFGLSIASGTGAPTLISPNALAADVAPIAMTVDPSGKFLLVAGLFNGGAAVGEYSINSDGTLAEIQGSPVTITFPANTDVTNLAVQQIVVAPNSSYVFVSLGQLGVVPLPFSSGGALSPNTSLITPKTNNVGGSTVSNQDMGLAVDSGSKFLFIGETNVGVRVATIAANSNFTEISGSPFAAGGQPHSIVLDGTGGFVYVANATDSTISGYSLQASGALTALAGSPFSSVGSNPTALALDQSKKFLIAANSGGNGSVQVFSFDATTAGKLDPGATVTNVGPSSTVASTH